MKEKKKKGNLCPNLLLFIACALFVVAGMFGEYFLKLGGQAVQYFRDLAEGRSASITQLTKQIDKLSADELFYHDQLMDLNSLYLSLTGSNTIKKEDCTIVRTDSGTLFIPAPRQTQWERDTLSNAVQELQSFVENSGSNFLYAIAPKKNNFVSPPSHIEDFERENLDAFIAELSKRGISYLDLRQGLEALSDDPEDLYFVTDHHWTPYAGFLANKLICEALADRYGFEPRQEALDISNYDITTYKDYFLGSHGKKTGLYFTRTGADDFHLITPKFHTDMTEEQPLKNQFREGTFAETALFMENLARRDYYNLNPYATYCGGDFRLQIFKDRLNADGKKVLIIRDSFAGAVCPFTALQFSEVHIMDIRNFSYYIGDKQDIAAYIRQIQPDYVILLYSVFDVTAGRYKFFE